MKKGDFKFFDCVLTKSVSTGGGTRKYAKAHSLSLSTTIYILQRQQRFSGEK